MSITIDKNTADLTGPAHAHVSRVTVTSGTQVTFGHELGITVTAGYRDDPRSYGGPMDGRGNGQPYVAITTDDLDPDWRYDDKTGLLGSTQDVYTVEQDEAGYKVMGPDGPVAAMFPESEHDFGASTRARDFAAMLNAQWERNCGMPAISVNLNDADLYDDEGQGDRVDNLSGKFIYMVPAATSDDFDALFTRKEDAEAFAATFGDDEGTTACKVFIAGPNEAAVMIRDRMPKFSVKVTDKYGRDLTDEQAHQRNIDGWSPGYVAGSRASEDCPIGDLSDLIEPEARVVLSQLIDAFREHGSTDDLAETELYPFAEQIVNGDHGFPIDLATPDGVTLTLDRKEA